MDDFTLDKIVKYIVVICYLANQKQKCACLNTAISLKVAR